MLVHNSRGNVPIKLNAPYDLLSIGVGRFRILEGGKV